MKVSNKISSKYKLGIFIWPIAILLWIDKRFNLHWNKPFLTWLQHQDDSICAHFRRRFNLQVTFCFEIRAYFSWIHVFRKHIYQQYSQNEMAALWASQCILCAHHLIRTYIFDVCWTTTQFNIRQIDNFTCSKYIVTIIQTSFIWGQFEVLHWFLINISLCKCRCKLNAIFFSRIK